MKSTHHTQSCSFCGKPKEQNRRLIAGPGVFICSECVSLCNEIIAEETGRGPGEGRPAAPCPPGVGRASRWWQRSRPSADQAPSSLLQLHSSEF